MTWREDLRRVRITVNGTPKVLIGASFRGVPFFVESVDMSTGRRVVVHEFPLRDDPFVEDLGRRSRKFRVDGYVIGDDYQPQRDALLDALEAEGPGELLLPYYDAKRAIGETTSVRETKSDGGMAVFALEFCEAPTQAPVPTQVDDPAGRVTRSADVAQTAIRAEVVEKFTVAGMPAFALASAEAGITRAAAAFATFLGPVARTTQELASLNGKVVAITAQASSLARDPGAAIDAFIDAIVGLADTVAEAPGDVVDALAEAYAEDLGAPANGTTATRQREIENQLALTGALRRVMAIEAARFAPVVAYESIEDATAARDRVAAMLEEQASGAGDTAYPSLVNLRSDVLRAVPGGTAFAHTLTVTRRVPIPSLLLAYQLYGSVSQELDIIARNRIQHPGFVVGDLQVLSNV
jgi:prophage DNA circulation protein